RHREWNATEPTTSKRVTISCVWPNPTHSPRRSRSLTGLEQHGLDGGELTVAAKRPRATSRQSRAVLTLFPSRLFICARTIHAVRYRLCALTRTGNAPSRCDRRRRHAWRQLSEVTNAVPLKKLAIASRFASRLESWRLLTQTYASFTQGASVSSTAVERDNGHSGNRNASKAGGHGVLRQRDCCRRRTEHVRSPQWPHEEWEGALRPRGGHPAAAATLDAGPDRERPRLRPRASGSISFRLLHRRRYALLLFPAALRLRPGQK